MDLECTAVEKFSVWIRLAEGEALERVVELQSVHGVE